MSKKHMEIYISWIWWKLDKPSKCYKNFVIYTTEGALHKYNPSLSNVVSNYVQMLIIHSHA